MNQLQHHGIQGMKWGVRRYQNKDGTLTATGKKRYSGKDSPVKPHEDHSKAHSEKRIQEMSDKELRERLSRLNMEQQYKKLSPSKVSKGKKVLDDAIKVGTTVATVTSTALTIYNNFDKIKGIFKKNGG